MDRNDVRGKEKRVGDSDQEAHDPPADAVTRGAATPQQKARR
jgi:hypothetical protein